MFGFLEQIEEAKKMDADPDRLRKEKRRIEQLIAIEKKHRKGIRKQFEKEVGPLSKIEEIKDGVKEIMNGLNNIFYKDGEFIENYSRRHSWVFCEFVLKSRSNFFDSMDRECENYASVFLAAPAKFKPKGYFVLNLYIPDGWPDHAADAKYNFFYEETESTSINELENTFIEIFINLLRNMLKARGY